MMTTNIGDLARSLTLREANSRFKTAMTRLSNELTSGRVSDPIRHLSGSLPSLVGVERSLAIHDAWMTNGREVAGMAQGQQSALGFIADRAQAAGIEIAAYGTNYNDVQLGATLRAAAEDFKGVVASLNSGFGGRSLFSGAATKTTSLVSSDDMLADLSIVVAGQTTAAGVMAAVDSWFSTPGGGFETNAYLGSDDPMAPFALGEQENARLETTATNPVLRQSLMGFALSALMDAGTPALATPERKILAIDIGDLLLNNNTDLIRLAANVGYEQERVEAADARNGASKTALSLAREALIGIDPYDTAAQLSQVETQLETVYTLTARMSQMSLASILR